MNHTFKQKVFYSDTDAYGVVWHGSYLRWLEMGRVLLCEKANLKLSELEKEDIILPVSELNIKYKQSARLDNELIIETKIEKQGKFYILFKQTITEEKTKKLLIEATVQVVAIHNDGRLYRTLPDKLQNLAS